MTTTPQITPRTSTLAAKASAGIESSRVEKATAKVLETLAAIAGAKKNLAKVLAEHDVTVRKITGTFEGPRDSLMHAKGFEYRLKDWQDSADPLEGKERMAISGALEDPLYEMASGFSRIVVSPDNDDLLIKFFSDPVPPGFFMRPEGWPCI